MARQSLLRNVPFVALLSARGISLAGDQIATVALVLLVSRDHPATAVGGLLLADSLPWLLAPLAGAFVDRAEKRRLMIACQLGQGVIFIAITAWLPPYGALLLLIALASTLGTTLRAGTATSMPMIVEDDQLLSGNALLGVALNLGVMLGPAIGGALAGLAGSRLALGVDAATFFASSVVLTRLPPLPSKPSPEGVASGPLRSTVEGLRYAFGDPILRALMLSLTLLVAFAGVDNVALVYLVRDTFGSGAVAFGVATACFGAGMILATAGLLRSRHRREVGILVAGNVATGAGTILSGITPWLAGLFPAQILGGIGNGLENAAQSTLIQRLSPPEMLGRVSGAENAAVGVAFLAAYVGGGALVEVTSPRTTFVIAGIGALLSIAVLRPLMKDPAASSGVARQEVASALPAATEEESLD